MNDYVVNEWKSFAAEDENAGFAAAAEKNAADELIAVKESLPDEYLHESGLDAVSTVEGLLADRDRLLEIAAYFSDLSIDSETDTDDDGVPVIIMHMQNTELIPACLLIDLTATACHVTFGLPTDVYVYLPDNAQTIAHRRSFTEGVKHVKDVRDVYVRTEEDAEEDEEPAPFEDDTNVFLDELAIEYAENNSNVTYGRIIALLVAAMADSESAMFPAARSDDPEEELPLTYTCVGRKNGEKYLVLQTEACDRFEYMVRVPLKRAFNELRSDEIEGLVINPYTDSVVIEPYPLTAALDLYDSGVDYGRRCAEKDDRELETSRPMPGKIFGYIENKIETLVQDDTGSFFILTFSDFVNDDTVMFMQTKKCDAGYRVEIAFDMSDLGQEVPMILAADDVPLETTLELFRRVASGEETGDIEFIRENFRDIGFDGIRAAGDKG